MARVPNQGHDMQNHAWILTTLRDLKEYADLNHLWRLQIPLSEVLNEAKNIFEGDKAVRGADQEGSVRVTQSVRASKVPISDGSSRKH